MPEPVIPPLHRWNFSISPATCRLCGLMPAEGGVTCMITRKTVVPGHTPKGPKPRTSDRDLPTRRRRPDHRVRYRHSLKGTG